MVKVLNKSSWRRWPASSSGTVYVGRPTKWGNPFAIGRDGDRETVISKYTAWVLKQDHLMRALPELKGKDLVCWCAPQRCHAEVLAHLANDEEGTSES